MDTQLDFQSVLCFTHTLLSAVKSRSMMVLCGKVGEWIPTKIAAGTLSHVYMQGWMEPAATDQHQYRRSYGCHNNRSESVDVRWAHLQIIVIPNIRFEKTKKKERKTDFIVIVEHQATEKSLISSRWMDRDTTSKEWQYFPVFFFFFLSLLSNLFSDQRRS